MSQIDSNLRKLTCKSLVALCPRYWIKLVCEAIKSSNRNNITLITCQAFRWARDDWEDLRVQRSRFYPRFLDGSYKYAILSARRIYKSIRVS